MAKNKHNYGVFFRVCRTVVRLFCKKKKVVGKIPDSPCIILCRHLDNDGVVSSLVSLPTVVRPWCLDIFFDRKSAIKQFRNYTFSAKMKKSKAFCAIASPVVGTVYSALVKSAKCIPVYRGEKSNKSIQTIKQSVRALENGENILIYNDIDYADTNTETSSGEIYHGFTAVDKMFFKRNGKHIPIVPVFMDKKSVVIHPPVFCDDTSVIDKVRYGMYNAQKK